jgi:4-hydroxy-tetrahydrodipicolinate synthase
MIPALKAAIAHFGNDPQWKTCRPPLIELSSSEETTLISDLRAHGFSMPGL